MVTFLAVPFESVLHSFRSRHFNNQSNRSGIKPLRRVRHVFWQEENFSFLNGDLDGRFAWFRHQAQKNISFQLVEKFLGGVVVIAVAVLRPSHHGYHHLAIFPDLRVPHGRLQFFAIRVNPALEVKSFQRFDRWHSVLLSANAWISRSTRVCTRSLSFQSTNTRGAIDGLLR